MRLFQIVLLLLFVSTLTTRLAHADKTDARVRTDSGTYRVPVEVEDGEVTKVYWPNGGNMRVRGADIEDGEAIGRDYDGNRIRIEVEDDGSSEDE